MINKINDINTIQNSLPNEKSCRFHKIILKFTVIFSFFIYFSNEMLCQTTSTYTVTGTWTAPAGVTSVTVTCIGGGGAGGRSYTTDGGAGGGGAGGASVTSTLTVVAGTSYSVTVGASKASSTISNTASNNDGNPSWFSTAATIFAQGGAGGTGVTTAAAGAGGTGSIATSIGTTKYAGGNATNGNVTPGTTGGAGGGGSGTTGAGGNAVTGTGGTGTTLYGGNGANGVTDNTDGLSGSNYGAGGSGGKRISTTDRNGGAGAQGIVTITYMPVNNDIFSGGNEDGFAMARYGSAGSEVPLPIELLYFDAICNIGKVNISWATASQTNNDYFTIERSVDAINFEIIGTIDGAGNSNQTTSYSFIDTEPLPDISYYRLKQTDFDRKFKYFKLIAATCDSNFPTIKIYPNPNTGSFILESKELNSQLIILNPLGQKVLEQKITSIKTDIDLSNLSKGIYYLQLSSAKLNTTKRISIIQ